jgi:magnesium chelatase family protein
MALAEVKGVVMTGFHGTLVGVEVDISAGLPSVGIIGLGDTAVGEARWRLRSAFNSIPAAWPGSRVTIGLSPADLPKRGTGLDVAMAVGLLQACDAVDATMTSGVLFFGELALDGSIRYVHGGIAAAVAARAAGLHTLMTSPESAREAAAIPDVRVIAVQSLRECAEVLRGSPGTSVAFASVLAPESVRGDFADVRGHAFARYACEVAAAGRHHMLIQGSPGVGKTMLAERLVSVLPRLTPDQAVEVTTMASLAGRLPRGHGLVTEPPFQAPHHSASATALLGTIRRGLGLPGALSLAHHGVLFLDEAAEFPRPALEGLRQPLESGRICIARAGASVDMPADIQLILAANPCPCGYRGNPSKACQCSSVDVRRYAAKLSGPLLDRIDVQLHVLAPTAAQLKGTGEASGPIGERVLAARERAAHRFHNVPWKVNAAIPSKALRHQFLPDAKAVAMLEQWEQSAVSLRASDRIARMAWSICDLREGQQPSIEDLGAALSLRGDREIS